MKSCPACGADNDGGSRFCLECGESFDDLPEAPTDPWLGRMVSGRFRIIRKLGDGGMGEVYLAEQLPMGREVALKVLRQHLADDPQAVERFQREAQAASQLTDQHTITVYDFGQDEDGTLFLAMEFLEGQPLDELLAGDRIDPARAARILAQVCGSLEEAHGRGMVHRDLKPENIFLTVRGRDPDYVKVLDFGIAKVTQSPKGEKLETITRAGAIFGTPQYMSPEQIRGEELDARSDVYALGVILYEMISGQLPFKAGTVMELLTQHLNAAPAPITGSPAHHGSAAAKLEAAALRALSKDPNARQPSARAFLEDIMAAMPNLTLDSMTHLEPVTAGAPAAVLDAPAPSGSSLSVVVLAALVAAGAAGAFFFLNGGPGGSASGPDVAPAFVGQEAAADDATPAEPAKDDAEKPAEEKAAAAEEKPAEAEEAAEPAAKEVSEEEAKKIEVEAEAEAKAAEEEAKAAEEEAKAAEKGGELSEAEANAIAAKAEAEAKAAEAEAAAAANAVKAAEATEKAKAAEESAKAAAAEKAAAESAKAEAEAKAAEQQAKAAEAQAAQAKSDAEREAAEAAKAQADAARVEAEKAAAAQAAEAEKLKAEVARVRAEAEAAKAEAEAAKAVIEEARVKAEEAKAKAEAARKRRRAKLKTGKVFVSTKSRNAKVYIDGKFKGRTPLKALRLKPGKHRIELRIGKKKKGRRITVKAGRVLRVKFNL